MNEIPGRIAELNDKIQVAEASGHVANDFRDERQQLLEQLSQLVDVSFVEEDDGAMTVFVGRGFTLVQKNTASQLKGVEDLDNIVGSSPPTALKEVHFVNPCGVTTDMTSRISGGEIGGLLEFRDNTLANLLDEIDQFAAAVVNQVNIIHNQGFGLDGSTNLNFFNPLKLTVDAATANSVDAVSGNPNVRFVSSDSRIYDPTALTGANYRIEFTSATTFQIIDTDTGLKVDATRVSVNGGPLGTDPSVTDFTYAGTGVTVEFEGLRVTLQNLGGPPVKGDAFEVSTRKSAARNMALNAVVSNDINKLAAAGAPNAPGDNTTALALAGLREKSVARHGSSTLGAFLNSIVTAFGSTGRDIAAKENVTTQVSDTLKETREGISGVSLDEEMANIVRFQRIFGASAQLMSVASDLMDSILEIV